MKIQLTEGDKGLGPVVWGRIISTHALTEGDGIVSGLASTGAFQLTPSWRATKTDCSCNSSGHISTHALTEGDLSSFLSRSVPYIFQLTPSRRATLKASVNTKEWAFQLTPSRRATMGSMDNDVDMVFQLTPSRRATLTVHSFCRLRIEFQLTPSRRATMR